MGSERYVGTLDLAGGADAGTASATIQITSGQVTWDDTTTMQLVSAGAIVDWVGAQPQSGYLTYTFRGAI